MYFRFILAYTTNGTGGPMSVYVSICMYICRKYMHIHQSVYVRISSSIFVCISSSISVRILYVYPAVVLDFFFVHITVTVPSQLLRIRRRRRAVSAPSPRGRYGKFVARLRKRRQIAKFNQIWSARLNSGSQWQLVQARPYCALKCHGNRGWRSFTR